MGALRNNKTKAYTRKHLRKRRLLLEEETRKRRTRKSAPEYVDKRSFR